MVDTLRSEAVAYSISRESGRRTYKLLITGHSTEAYTRICGVLHSPGQLSPALMLILAILLHPPPTPCQHMQR